VKIHTGELSYECNACDNRFSVKFNLQRHQRHVHKWEQNLVCRMYYLVLDIGYSMSVYMLTHTWGKSNKCRLCDQKFDNNIVC